MSDTSSLYSLSESLLRDLYRLQGKRRRQNSVPLQDYYWPCDQAAVRMELAAAAGCDVVCENGLFWDPDGEVDAMLSSPGVEGPCRILDLGSGSTSSWAISMAERYPDCEVIGVDLVPPDLSFLPSNLSIEVHDLLEGLPYPDDFFTLIHGRTTSAASFFDDEHTILPEISRVLQPGGALVLEEVENALQPISSHDSHNPYLSLARARHKLRMDVLLSQAPEAIPRKTWGLRMAGEIQQTEGFKFKDGGRVDERGVEIPLGYSPQGGRPEAQAGTYLREFLLAAWEMNSVALGSDEEMIQSLREVDEMAVPEVDVGLHTRVRMVRAIKSGC